MEEATVETVPDQVETAWEEPTMLEYIQAWLLGYFSNPWALLILVFLLYKLTRLLAAPLSQRWADWSTARQQRAEAAAYKKDPDLYRAKMEQLETARLRMQERYNEDAERMAEKRREEEERRVQQDIKDWEEHQAGRGYKGR